MIDLRRPVKLGVWGSLLGTCCAVCHQREREGEKLQLHHVDGNPKNNARWNLRFVHKVCHNNLTELNEQYTQVSDSKARSEPMGGGEVKPAFSPAPKDEYRDRSIQIKNRLLDYLFQVAVKKGETASQILSNAPGFINLKDPPSDSALRRWLQTFSSGMYPYRFDDYGRIFLTKVEKIEELKEE